MRRRARMIIPGTTTLFAALDVKGQGNRIWSLRLLKAGSTSWGSGAVNSDRGCRNAEEPASVRSFARRKGSSAVNHLPDFSYAIALPEWLTVNSVRDDNNMVVNYVAIFSD